MRVSYKEGERDTDGGDGRRKLCKNYLEMLCKFSRWWRWLRPTATGDDLQSVFTGTICSDGRRLAATYGNGQHLQRWVTSDGLQRTMNDGDLETRSRETER